MYDAGEAECMPSEKLKRQMDDVKKDAEAILSLFQEESGNAERSQRNTED